MSIYNAWQTNHLLRKQFIQNLQPFIKQTNFGWLSHSTRPNTIEEAELKVLIGNEQCSQPYHSSILTIGTIINAGTDESFIHTIKKEKPGNFQNPGGEGVSAYRLEGEDLVWQIGPDYSGCRSESGNFDSKKFKQLARRSEVKMIELILPSVIKPKYPVDSFLDIEDRISKKRSGPGFQNSAHTTFSEAEGMIHFLGSLRQLSEGKPIGIRLCINNKKFLHEICYAIRKTELIPDFIVVEGSVEKNGIVHLEQSCYTGIPLYEALLFVSKTLQTYALEKKIKIIASGKVNSAFDILKMIALGANAVCTDLPGNSSIKYSANKRKKTPFFKSPNGADFHASLMNNTVQIMNACAFRSVSDVTVSNFFRRPDLFYTKDFKEPGNPTLYTGSVKKIYKPKIKSYQIKDERKKTLLHKNPTF